MSQIIYPKEVKVRRREFRIFLCEMAYTFIAQTPGDLERIKNMANNQEEFATPETMTCEQIQAVNESTLLSVQDNENHRPEATYRNSDMINYLAYRMAIQKLEEPGYTRDMFVETKAFKSLKDKILKQLEEYAAEFIKLG